MSIEREQLDQEIGTIVKAIEEKQEEINEKQKELDGFDISDYVDESHYKAQHDHETVEVMGVTFNALDVLEEMDYTAFRQGFNDWIDSLDPADHLEYKDIEEEKEELEDELTDLEDELEELHQKDFDMDNSD